MESINHAGQLKPILITPRGQIIDGVHRFIACNYLGIEPRIKIYEKNNLHMCYVISVEHIKLTKDLGDDET